MARAIPSTPALDAGNVALVVGTLSGPPRRRELPSGTVLVEFDVTTRGDTGTASVPVAWFDPGAAADGLDANASVVVAGHVRRRVLRAGGATQSRTEVVASRVVIGNRPAVIDRLRALLAETITAAS